MNQPLSRDRSRAPIPGRTCPLHYRYAVRDLARDAEVTADTVYVVGGLYGNGPALSALLGLASRETQPVTLIFNGDFNWFNVDGPGFATINDEVLKHTAIRGNVETEIAGENSDAGCGCGYPDWVGEAEVARSNQIIERLRETACRFPDRRAKLAALPMHITADIGGVRVAIVHGDAESLAGWDFSQEMLSSPSHRKQIASQFATARARIFASSHTCLPVAADFDTPKGKCVLFNSGAAGMPNFSGMRYGVVTRIATRPATHTAPLYGIRIDAAYVEALPLHYDSRQWKEKFLGNWPPGSPAHASYFRRITEGPAYDIRKAVRLTAEAA